MAPASETDLEMGDGSGTKQIQIQCRCGKRLTGPASAIGQTIACPACGQRMRLASAGAAAARPAPSAVKSAPPAVNPKPPAVKPAAPAVKSVQRQPKVASPPADVSLCDNCGASLASSAVICVECGFDRRQGQVLARTPSPKEKKGRKSKRSFPLPKPAILAIALGVPVLIGGGTGLFFMLRGGSSHPAPATAAQAPITSAAVASPRVVRPEPSKDPKDWQKSFAAFAANFSVQQTRDQLAAPRWEIRGGQISLAEDTPTIQWEGLLLGPDRRMIVLPASADTPKRAVGFGFPELAALPEPLAILFSIDENRAGELFKLSYRWVRFEGKLDPVPRVVGVTDKGYPTEAVAGPPLQAGEVTTVGLHGDRDVRLIYVLWLDIVRFELVK